MPRIAFATCADLVPLDPDDELLAEAVRMLGGDVVPCVWDDGAVDWSAFDLVLVRSPWDYHLRHDAFLGWAARVGREARLLNRASTIAWNSDKTYLRELAERGVPTVPTAWVQRDGGAAVPDLSALLAAHGWQNGEAIVKPVVGLGSSGLLRVAPGDPDGAGATHLAELAAAGDAMVQPFVPSLPAEGELSLVFFERRLSHVIRKRPPLGEFRVQPHFGAVTTADTASAQQLAVAEQALACVEDDALLYARVDLVAGPRGEIWLMELELIEPTLYFEAAPGSAERFARLIVDAAAG
jgi:glutathione synthase/RimK-type ligase-like ATP-grasp enzyme